MKYEVEIMMKRTFPYESSVAVFGFSVVEKAMEEKRRVMVVVTEDKSRYIPPPLRAEQEENEE